ncbi:MAG TPA: DUF5777 family beta-barrel protein [Thermoanaerobaculia bacterium]|nr:DUF5777 family beta-barrel protein [Thermoanaerobaculia bacterium]
MIKRLVISAAVMLTTIAASAQNRYTPITPIPLGDTLLTLPTSHIPSEGTWEVKFTHRFNQSIDQGNGSDRVHSLWGLDSNADVALGLSYTPHRDLEFSLMRSNALDDIEIAAKYIVVQQAAAIPIALAVRGGADWRTEQNLRDRTSFFAQLILSRQLGSRAEVFVLPTYVTNAGRVVSGSSSQAMFDHASNVPFGVAVQIHPGLSVVGELIPKNRDLPDATSGDFAWALGLKRAIGGHYFEVLLTNSNSTMADQYVTTTYQGAGLNRGDLHLGFNIERRFGRR